MHFKNWKFIKKHERKNNEQKEENVLIFKNKNIQPKSTEILNNSKKEDNKVKLHKSKTHNKAINSSNKKGISIRKKIPLLIGVLIIISMVSTSIFTYIKSSSIIFNQSKAEMMSVNKRVIETISVMIEKEQSQVQAICNTKQIFEIMKLKDKSDAISLSQYTNVVNENNDKFSTYISNNTNVERVSLVDMNGNILSDSDNSYIGKSVADQTYHSVSSSGGLAVSETIKSEKSGNAIYKSCKG